MAFWFRKSEARNLGLKTTFPSRPRARLGNWSGTTSSKARSWTRANGSIARTASGGMAGGAGRQSAWTPSRVHFRGSITTVVPFEAGGQASSQFYLLFMPRHGLDGKNTCFGRIDKGFDVLSRLPRVTPRQFDSIEPGRIIDAKVLRKRNHPYEAKKAPAPKP